MEITLAPPAFNPSGDETRGGVGVSETLFIYHISVLAGFLFFLGDIDFF